MRVTINGTVVAEAANADLIEIENNWYFPPSSLKDGAFSNSPTPYNCPWKGDCQYHDVTTAGGTHHDAAWSYPEPYPASIETVGRDYSGYVAFDKAQATIG